MKDIKLPFSHVHPGCPPTLFIQGNHDVVCFMDATQVLYTKRVESGEPTINVVYPWTDHTSGECRIARPNLKRRNKLDEYCADLLLPGSPTRLEKIQPRRVIWVARTNCSEIPSSPAAKEVSKSHPLISQQSRNVILINGQVTIQASA